MNRALAELIEVLAEQASHLGQQVGGLGLQLVGAADDAIGGEGVLDEGGRLPGFMPTHSGIEDGMGDLLDRRQRLIELDRAIEIGAGIDPLELQTHVIGAHIAQFKHPGFDGVGQGILGIQLPHQLNR